MSLPSSVTQISVSKASLPQTYERAKTALAECARIDECKDWADKAEAMASYAKQADDDTLRKMADRIQARAIRRCGELLKLIEPATGRNLPNVSKGSAPSRSEAAEQAGLSERQRKTALRVANLPEDDFEASVESENPPTVTQLAERGKQTRTQEPPAYLQGLPPEQFNTRIHVLGALRRYAEKCDQHDAEYVVAAILDPDEIAEFRKLVATVDAWHDVAIANLRDPSS